MNQLVQYFRGVREMEIENAGGMEAYQETVREMIETKGPIRDLCGNEIVETDTVHMVVVHLPRGAISVERVFWSSLDKLALKYEYIGVHDGSGAPMIKLRGS